MSIDFTLDRIDPKFRTPLPEVTCTWCDKPITYAGIPVRTVNGITFHVHGGVDHSPACALKMAVSILAEDLSGSGEAIANRQTKAIALLNDVLQLNAEWKAAEQAAMEVVA